MNKLHFIYVACIILSLLFFAYERMDPNKHWTTYTTGSLAKYPACGEVCQYTETIDDESGRTMYPQIKKHFDCDVIMRRMAYRDHIIQYPPPESPPADMLDAFTQFGEMPIAETLYKISFRDSEMQPKVKVYTENDVNNLIAQANEGINVNTYNDNGCMFEQIQKYRQTVANKTGVVIGTLRPWLEAMLLSVGASNVTTLEYGQIILPHPQLKHYDPYSFADNFVNGKSTPFGFAASFSSLEHSGLGRYGDPLNPYGDMEAMAQIWCMVKPGGYMILGVPSARDDHSHIKWNAHRVYGSKRLKHLTANWKLVELNRCDDSNHMVLVLVKPDEPDQ